MAAVGLLILQGGVPFSYWMLNGSSSRSKHVCLSCAALTIDLRTRCKEESVYRKQRESSLNVAIKSRYLAFTHHANLRRPCLPRNFIKTEVCGAKPS